MIIDQHTLTVDGVTVDLPRLPKPAKVTVWRVPADYRHDGLFVAVTPVGQPAEVPACNIADCELLGEADLSADEHAALAAKKTEARDCIDSAAGRARARYVTVAPGQEATYQAKQAEADAYVAAGGPSDTSGYPILTAEAQARGITVAELADLVRGLRDQWLQAAASIEAIRIGGKGAVDAAPDQAAIEAAVSQALGQLEVV